MKVCCLPGVAYALRLSGLVGVALVLGVTVQAAEVVQVGEAAHGR